MSFACNDVDAIIAITLNRMMGFMMELLGRVSRAGLELWQWNLIETGLLVGGRLVVSSRYLHVC